MTRCLPRPGELNALASALGVDQAALDRRNTQFRRFRDPGVVFNGQKLFFLRVIREDSTGFEFIGPSVQLQGAARDSGRHAGVCSQTLDLYEDVLFDGCRQPRLLIGEMAVVLFDNPYGRVCMFEPFLDGT